MGLPLNVPTCGPRLGWSSPSHQYQGPSSSEIKVLRCAKAACSAGPPQLCSSSGVATSGASASTNSNCYHPGSQSRVISSGLSMIDIMLGLIRPIWVLLRNDISSLCIENDWPGYGYMLLARRRAIIRGHLPYLVFPIIQALQHRHGLEEAVCLKTESGINGVSSPSTAHSQPCQPVILLLVPTQATGGT